MVALLTAACAGTLTFRDVCLGIPNVLEVKVGELTIHFRLGTNEKYYITFKKNGEPVSTACIQGGEGTIPNPNGGDWDQLDYTTEKPAPVVDAEPIERLLTELRGGDGLVASPAPMPLIREYNVGCIQGTYDTDVINSNYTLTVKAKSVDQASSLGATFGQNGPGAVVSSSVHVDSFLRWTVIGGDLWIGSSKVGADFVDYQLTVNGSVVADLASQTNVIGIDEANQWTTLWSAVPLSDLNFGTNTIDVVQRAVGESSSYPIHLDFDL